MPFYHHLRSTLGHYLNSSGRLRKRNRTTPTRADASARIGGDGADFFSIIRRYYSISSNGYSISSNQARSNATQEVGNIPRRFNTSKRAPKFSPSQESYPTRLRWFIVITQNVIERRALPDEWFSDWLPNELFWNELFSGEVPLHFIIVVRLALDKCNRTIAQKSKWPSFNYCSVAYDQPNECLQTICATQCKPNIYIAWERTPRDQIQLGNVPLTIKWA